MDRRSPTRHDTGWKRYVRGFLGLAVCGCVVSGCASVDGVFANDSDVVLRTSLTFVDLDFQPIADNILDNAEERKLRYPYAEFPETVILHFGYVAGRTAGPNAPDFFDRLWLTRKNTKVEWNAQRDFEINLSFLERKLGQVATRYVSRPEDTDFRVRPQETRLAGLLLGVTEAHTLGKFYVAIPMFYDWGSGDPLMLIYVDQPCQISGSVDTSKVGGFVERIPELSRRIGGVFQQELSLSKAGLHWISLKSTGDGRITMRNVNPVGPIGVVVLENGVALWAHEHKQ